MNTPLSFVWINKRPWLHPGPIVNMALHNAHSFSTLGFESHFVVGESATPGAETEADLRAFYGLEPSGRFRVHRIPRATGSGSGSGPVYQAAAALIRRLAERGPVAVFTREAGMLPRLAWLRRNPRIRAFYELHDCYADLTWRPKTRFKDHREKWVERLFLPRIDGIVCITREQEALYRGIFPGIRSTALSLGTKPGPAPDPERRRAARTLFYVGHMHGSKGVQFLLEAATALAARGIRMEFWGGYEHNVRKINTQAAHGGFSGMIQAVAFRPPAELHHALQERGSLGVVMLADTYYNRNLTCPVKALDYLSHGMPALATDLPSTRGVLDRAGIYLPEGDAGAFVERAAGLLDDPAAYAAASAAAQARAQELTWTRRAEALTAFARDAFNPG